MAYIRAVHVYQRMPTMAPRPGSRQLRTRRGHDHSATFGKYEGPGRVRDIPGSRWHQGRARPDFRCRPWAGHKRY
ncbi:uncharacterized protein A4U43_C03F4400 [Asparagus officinalis]|uniref:Uncharacterized protein n=1 Tax=Asparagus officinalis TaxID=4686 RepID=A0A5P1FA15_ASPOF|nr:uncharacterized protein A4U43_C03F4400 [Asparagus officinalis]